MDPQEFHDADDDEGLISKERVIRRKRCASFYCTRNSVIVITVLMIFFFGVITVLLFTPSDSVHSATGYYKHAAVATDAPQCSSIGKSILQDKNGSAVDAAIASLFCLGIHNAHSCGIGGGFFMVVYDFPRNGDKKTLTAFDAREVAPLAATRDMFFNSTLSLIGGKSIAVPGEIQGYYSAWKMYGRLAWRDLITPAIEMCRNGYSVDYALGKSIKDFEPSIRASPGLSQLFVKKNGELYKEGDIMTRPKLSRTLERIASIQSIEELQSDVFPDMVKDIKEHDGIVTEEDFAKYKVKITTPLSIPLSGTNNYTIHSLGPPGSGIIYAFMLRLLEGYNLTYRDISGERKSVETYHKIIESFKFSYALRTYLGDEDFVNNTKMMNQLLNQSFADSTRARINLTHTQDLSYYGPEADLTRDAGTSHLSILSSNGGAVAATSTINYKFGSHIVGSRTGVIFNDEMGDFSLPGKLEGGLAPSKENFIAPGKRPMSSMCPSIILDERGDVVMIIGGSGGSQITTAVAWVTAHTLWLGKKINEAIDMYRLHDQLIPNGFIAEPKFSKGIIEGLKEKGHEVRDDGLDNVVQAIHSTCHHRSWTCTDSNQSPPCSRTCITAVCDGRKGGKPEGY